MSKDLETKKRYAERYGAFFGAVIYLIHKKLDRVSFGETSERV